MNRIYLIKKIFKFAGVGGIATGLHAAVFFILINLITVSPQYSNFFAYLIAVSVSYFGHKKITFNKLDNSDASTVTKFLATSMFGFLLNAFWVFIVVDLLVFNSNFSLIGICFLTPSISFILMNSWVFRNKKQKKSAVS
ncbi:MAG: putative flippase GtrA [Marivirga sp.]|jgi:putative flippase GtrA